MTGVGAIASSYATGPPAFTPLSIAWSRAWWAEDPGWTNPGDGVGVSSWRNAGTQGGNLTQGTGANQPTYRAAYANLNSKPAVQFDGGDFLDISGLGSLSQPNHIYVVGYQATGGGVTHPLHDSVSGDRHLLSVNASAGGKQMFAGTSTVNAPAVSAASFQCAGLFNTTSSALRANGSNHTGLNVGTQTTSATTRIGRGSGASTSYLTGAIAFIGVCDVALTAGELTDLSAWAVTHYGVPAL